MPIHDEYARITPFELAFPAEGGAVPRERLDTLVPAPGAAASTEDPSSLDDPGRFLTLPDVARTVSDLREPDAGSEALQKHGILLYHAVHFRRAGQPLFLLDARTARYLVETRPEPGLFDPPEAAGYLQLPRHLFWIEPDPDGTPEPVDGFFWVAPDGERISLLVISGVRGDRPGFSVLPLPTLPLDHGEGWITAQGREDGEDFRSTLPGGELERLYSLETAGEVLKLAGRAFLHLSRVPGAAVSEEAESGTSEATAPEPSALPYRRIRIEEGP